MSVTTWDNSSNNWTLVEFFTDKLCVVYVQMGDAIRTVAKKCGELSNLITNTIINDVSEKYRSEMVDRILEEIKKPPVAVLHSIEEYKKWQNSL